MPSRTIQASGKSWLVFPSGRVTQYDRDEFALVFVSGAGASREVRVTRYSPLGPRSREKSLVELSDYRCVDDAEDGELLLAFLDEDGCRVTLRLSRKLAASLCERLMRGPESANA